MNIANQRIAGLNQFTIAQKQISLAKLRDAAERLFGARGYLAVSIDDIAREAGVTRRTFYRHFNGKPEIATDLFERQKERARAVWAKICEMDFTDVEAISGWLNQLMDYYAKNAITRTIVELGFAEPAFQDEFKAIVPDLIAVLGVHIPAFSVQDDSIASHYRQAEAGLLIHQIREQCMLQTAGLSEFDPAMLTRLLANQFQRFVLQGDAPR
jgi:AcrR family transcriptional regulator